MPAEGRGSDVLADDAVFLSPAAQSWLNLRAGGALAVRAGTADLALRVAGPVQRARPGQRFGVMDIGALQWRFGQLGKLSRVDLKLRDGVNRAEFEARLDARPRTPLPGPLPGPAAERQRPAKPQQ